MLDKIVEFPRNKEEKHSRPHHNSRSSSSKNHRFSSSLGSLPPPLDSFFVYFYLFSKPSFSFLSFSKLFNPIFTLQPLSLISPSSLMEDEDKQALAALSSAPPPRKIHSYSQQLRSSSTPIPRSPLRKHSLESLPIPNPSNTTIADHFYDSSDDEFAPIKTTSTNNVKEDYVNLSVEGNADDQNRPFQPLTEFIGGGGGSGIFKVPKRAAVHPGRPPCLELRPHPLRETQVGKFLRNIACTGRQLWAGQESGVRFWNLDDTYERGHGVGIRVRRGDEDAAPFHESVSTSPTTCLMVDSGNRLVWTGHKDGKIKSWKMDQPVDDYSPFKEGLSWQAHRGPVLSMIFSSHGKH